MMEFGSTYPQPFTPQDREDQWLRFLYIELSSSIKEESQSFISILKSAEDLSLHNSSRVNQAIFYLLAFYADNFFYRRAI
jgi:hypothetical protein